MDILVSGGTIFTKEHRKGCGLSGEGKWFGHAEFEVLVIHPGGVSHGQLNIYKDLELQLEIWSEESDGGVSVASKKLILWEWIHSLGWACGARGE